MKPASDANNALSEAVKRQSAPCLARALQVTNIGNGILLIAGGLCIFFQCGNTVEDRDGNSSTETDTNVRRYMSAIYIIVFSIMLICFELRVQCIDRIVFRYFGFLFKPVGRFAFFFFVGMLAFSLNTFGIVAGVFTICNVLFNCYVLVKNEDYKKFVLDQTKRANADARRSELTGRSSAGRGGDSTTEMQMRSLKSGRDGRGDNHGRDAFADNDDSKDKLNPQGGDWEKFHDDETSSYYYYNHKTKETKWEV